MIYLDNAATSYPKPDTVYDAVDYANRHLSFNAGRGMYKQAVKCGLILDDLRKEIGSLCNSNYQNVTILSSATEALNIIINGLDLKDGDNIYISPFEHNAIVRPLYAIKKIVNINIQILPFHKDTWKPDLVKIENMFTLYNPKAIFCSQISNVTGLLIDYVSIFEKGKHFNSTNILDAAQGYGIVNVKSKDIDFVVFAGHKSLYGPFGIGGFINLTGKILKVTKSGGTGSDTLNHDMPDSGHERYEAGSPNVPAAYGLLEGIKYLKANDFYTKEKDLTDYAFKELAKLPNVNVFSPINKEDVLGIISISVDGYNADEVGTILSEEFNILVRTGYHCTPFIHEFIGSESTLGTIRISMGIFNSREHIDDLIKALKTL